MTKLSALLSAAGLAALVSLSGATAASAAGPIGTAIPSATVGSATGDVQTIDYRGHRHCHWRNGRRWCHGESNYRRDRYGYRPGITLRFGSGRDYDRRRWR